MEVSTIKFGLSIAAVLMTAIVLVFAAYCKIGGISPKGPKKDAES